MTRVLAVLVFLLALTGASGAVRADPAVVLTISTENTRDHVQTRTVARFIAELAARAGDRLKIVHHHSADLFRDRDVIRALATGQVDMAVPGMWQLDRYVPDIGLFMLPMFYGRPVSDHHRIRDGAVGAEINQALERTLDVVVLGRWIDLGFAHLYFTESPVARHEDLAGLRIRVPGGAANIARLRAFGADPLAIPWPDLPNALVQDRVDGVLTTHETVRSAALWDKGIRFAFEDRAYFPQYVPLVSRAFWARLPEDLRLAMVESWEAVVDAARRDAANAQKTAREVLQARGVTLVQPSDRALAHWRAIALGGQDDLVSRLGINPGLVQRAHQALAGE